jgi:hypothetical protein
MSVPESAPLNIWERSRLTEFLSILSKSAYTITLKDSPCASMVDLFELVTGTLPAQNSMDESFRDPVTHPTE